MEFTKEIKWFCLAVLKHLAGQVLTNCCVNDISNTKVRKFYPSVNFVYDIHFGQLQIGGTHLLRVMLVGDIPTYNVTNTIILLP